MRCERIIHTAANAAHKLYARGKHVCGLSQTRRCHARLRIMLHE
jgi:hypothetical protein